MATSLQQEFDEVERCKRADLGRWMAAAILLLNVLDWSLTNLALRDGLAEEMNPIGVALFEIGPGAALAVKVILPLLLWGAAAKAGYSRPVIWILGIILFIYNLVIINNVLAIAG